MLLLSGQLIWLPVIVLAFYFAWKENQKKEFGLFILLLILALAASDVTSSYILKNVFIRLRPCREEDLLPLIYQFGQKCGGRFGFVSSHSANSFSLVMFIIGTLNGKKKWLHLLWLMPLLVSYSRIYLGVHYPGDVVAGAAVGLFWGVFLSWSFRNSKKS